MSSIFPFARTLNSFPRLWLEILGVLALVGLVAGCGGSDDGSPQSVVVGGGGNTTPPSPTGTVSLSGAASVNRPGWLTLAATGSENVASVSLFRDGVLVGRDESREFAFRVPYTASKIATDRFEARAFDQSGRQIATGTFDVAVNIGRVIYVSGSGSDSASGLSETTAKRTLQAAHSISQAGDSILVMDGIYTQADTNADVLTITRSGRADAWIAYIGYPGQSPLIRGRNWQAIMVQASFIIIEGLTLEGNRADVTLAEAQAQMNNLNNPVTSGNGIGIAPTRTNPAVRPAHVIIRDNEVRDFPGGGIYASGADYVTIERNRVYRNAWYSPYANSGISVYQAWNSENSNATKYFIRENISYENYNFIPFFFSNADPSRRAVTDGNGIIIDDFRNTQNNSTLGVYRGRTLVENNIVFDNGGRGIQIFSSDGIDVINNTSWLNARHPDIESEIGVFFADNVLVLNSILFARPNRRINQLFEATNFAFSFNLVGGGTQFQAGNGTGNLTGDPRFVDPSRQNFSLLSQSPAIDAGRAAGSPPRDFFGNSRPRGAGVDIGAIETK